MANLSPMQLQLSDLFTLRGGNRDPGLQNTVGGGAPTALVFRPGGQLQAPPGFPNTPTPPGSNTNPNVVPGAQAGLRLPTQNILSRIGAGGGFVGQQGVGASGFSNVIDQMMGGQFSPTYNPYDADPLANQTTQPGDPNRRGQEAYSSLDDLINTIQPVSTPQPVSGNANGLRGLQGLQAFSRMNPQLANGIFGEGGLANLLQRFQSMFTPFQIGNTNSGVLGALRGLRGGRTR